MKNLLTILIITYLSLTINSIAQNQNNNKNEKVLRIGVLLPLSGEFKNTGESFLKAIQLALLDIGNENIKIYPKDSKANALHTYLSAKEFDRLGIKIVIGPIFHESLERLSEIKNVTFISFTNKTQEIPKNVISFGININSQINSLINYFNEIEVSKTFLLSPKAEYETQAKNIADSKLNFSKIFLYDSSPKKITGEIEKITKYRERKKDLERRIKILEKSDLYKDKKELKK
jgi:ABC-type branched-subunit amino acid transport system substrate-binding protein